MRSANIVLLFMAFLLAGCAAAQLAIEKKDLKVETIMSDTIFLDIEKQTGKKVYIDVKNTSDKNLNIQHKIMGILSSRGFTASDSAARADYILQVNILHVGQADISALQKNAHLRYGVPLASFIGGAAIGAATTHTATGLWTGGAIGLLAGSGAEIIAGSLVKDVTYAIITDVMISEKTTYKVKEGQVAHLAVGKGTTRTQNIERQSNHQRYQTRITSYANQVNLKFEEALPYIEDGLAKSIAGVF